MEKIFNRPFALAVFAALFSLLAAAALYREYRGFLDGALVRPHFYIVSDNAFKNHPIALRSLSRDISRCFEGMSALKGGVLKGEVKQKGYQSCLNFADKILQANPTHGEAHQLRAEALFNQKDFAGAAQQVQTAFMVASQSPWLVQRRVSVALLLPDQTDVRLRRMLDADLKNMMRIREQRVLLAKLYNVRPALRDAIIRNQDAFDARDVASFLAAVAKEKNG